jgi:hypothetical protein
MLPSPTPAQTHTHPRSHTQPGLLCQAHLVSPGKATHATTRACRPVLLAQAAPTHQRRRPSAARDQGRHVTHGGGGSQRGRDQPPAGAALLPPPPPQLTPALCDTRCAGRGGGGGGGVFLGLGRGTAVAVAVGLVCVCGGGGGGKGQWLPAGGRERGGGGGSRAHGRPRGPGAVELDDRGQRGETRTRYWGQGSAGTPLARAGRGSTPRRTWAGATLGADAVPQRGDGVQLAAPQASLVLLQGRG